MTLQELHAVVGKLDGDDWREIVKFADSRVIWSEAARRRSMMARKPRGGKRQGAGRPKAQRQVNIDDTRDVMDRALAKEDTK